MPGYAFVCRGGRLFRRDVFTPAEPAAAARHHYRYRCAAFGFLFLENNVRRAAETALRYSAAPACFSFSTISQRSANPAAIMAVRPCEVRRFTSAPAARNISTSSALPSEAATIRDVVPFVSEAFTSAPRSINERATSAAPLTTATRIAGLPLSLFVSGSTP